MADTDLKLRVVLVPCPAGSVSFGISSFLPKIREEGGGGGRLGVTIRPLP